MDHNKLKEWIATMDGFPKFDTAYLQKTRSGGYATVLTYVLMAALMFAELYRYVLPSLAQKYVVDPTIGSKIKLTLDISVASECEKIVVLQVEQTGKTRVVSESLEAIDEHFDDNLPEDWVDKVKTVKNGDNYGYHPLNGCRIRGTIAVNKGQGRLMILPLLSTMGPMGQLMGKLDPDVNFSHYIHHFNFGIDYPGMRNPLDGSNQLAMASREHFTYFLSIIPTLFMDNVWRHHVMTNQYTLNGFKGKTDFRDIHDPGLFFRYDHEPLALIINRHRIPFRSFLVHLVGILGGIYTCSGLLHRVIHWTWEVCLWVVGKDTARKRAGRFDAGWSPVMDSEKPIIIKSRSIVMDTSQQDDDCIA